MIKHENINTKGIEQGYGTRLYLKMLLNKQKIMRVLSLFIILQGLNLKKSQ